jgi:hypothetical protein
VEPAAVPYPARFTFDPPEHIARWRPLLSWLLAIPHFLVLWAVQLVASICVFIGWFAILFTGKLPEGLARFPVMLLRYQTRVSTYTMFLQEEYPPFEFSSDGGDPGDYPRTRVELEPALEGRNRLTTFFRYFMILPHVIVLAFVGLAVSIVFMVAWFAVIILGRWPDGMRDFVVGFLRWSTRLNAYAMLLTDEYPPFTTR